MRRFIRPARILICLTLLCALLTGAARASAVKLPAIFSDNMVFQRDKDIRIWGWADKGEKLYVLFNGDKKTVRADKDRDGSWEVKFGSMKAGGPHELTIISGSGEVKLSNIMIGDVWVCSGQSNMEFQQKGSVNAAQEAASADFPKIRLFSVKKKIAADPQDDCVGQWSTCSPQTVGMFSAVGYYFGREVFKETDVPIGLIHTSWGGTPAEAWTTQKTVNEQFHAIIGHDDKYRADYPQAQEKYEAALRKFQADLADARANNKPVPKPPRKPYAPEENPNFTSVLYNGMIHPLVNFSIKGAIWYQGESNASRAYQYRTLLPAMIKDWRQVWNKNCGTGDFPFYIVQLANYKSGYVPTADGKPPASSSWAELREAQFMTTLALPHCGIATAIDIGNADDIHPTNKQEVGRRLALCALNQVYEKHNVEYSGPVYKSFSREDKNRKIRVKFEHISGGLVTGAFDNAALKFSETEGEVKGFTIAGEDGKFSYATAQLDPKHPDEVLVFSPDVPKPVAVRYAWANNPACNLYNKDGLPALPFRTDDWNGETQGKE